MYLHALATAVPPQRFTQTQCWKVALQSNLGTSLQRRSMLVLRAILTGPNSGITSRHFATDDLDRIFDRTPDDLNALFRRAAPQLAADALKQALAKAACDVREVDALLISTCTGYLCPGVTSYVGELLGLRSDAFLQDLVGLGCGAAIPTLRAADAVLRQNPDATVACISVEISSAAFYLDDDVGVLVSACLFADGAAATLWRSRPADASALSCDSFSTCHVPAERDRLRFEQRNGKLRNLLHPTVPLLAGAAVRDLHATEAARAGAKPIARAIVHPGGRDVLDEIERQLPQFELDASRRVLDRYGNMSSPSVLFALAEALTTDLPPADTDWWLTSFGAGFSVHGCRFGRRPAN